MPLEVRRLDGAQAGEVHTVDEGIRFDATLEAIASVKLLAENGRVTAATASQICDGASAVLVVNEKALKAHGLTPLARIHHMRSDEHTSELQSLMRISYAVFCLKKTNVRQNKKTHIYTPLQQ